MRGGGVGAFHIFCYVPVPDSSFGDGGQRGEVPGPSDRRAIYAVLRGAWTLRRLRDEASPQIMHLFEPRVTVPSP